MSFWHVSFSTYRIFKDGLGLCCTFPKTSLSSCHFLFLQELMAPFDKENYLENKIWVISELFAVGASLFSILDCSVDRYLPHTSPITQTMYLSLTFFPKYIYLTFCLIIVKRMTSHSAVPIQCHISYSVFLPFFGTFFYNTETTSSVDQYILINIFIYCINKYSLGHFSLLHNTWMPSHIAI
jgi:hypothetical protein